MTETVFNFASVVLLFLSVIFGSTRAFQMLQQNSYVNSRFRGWLFDGWILDLIISVVQIASFSAVYILFKKSIFSVLCLLTLIMSIASSCSGQKKSIKPLVYTARVKRMYVTLSIIFLILTGLMAVPSLFGIVPFTAIVIFAFGDFAVPIVNLINKPIEKAVSQHFISDAKRILKSSPDMTVIGVTGSYGKTTTKFILERLLSEKYTVTVTPESFNTPMGVVRTIREKMKPATEIFIAEMGAKNVGDIKEICDIVNPSVGLITSVGPQHLNTFGSVENIIDTKFELADAVALKNGKIFLNGDNEYISERSVRYENTVLYGTDKENFCRAENITCSSAGSSFDICIGDERIPVTTRLLGTHNVLNILGATAIAHDLGVSSNDIKFSVNALKPVAHRLEMKSFAKGATLIDDAYNSNPKGCIEAVNVLSHFEGMKKIIVTPGLVELGDKEYECNYKLGLEAGKICDEIYLVGIERSKPMSAALDKLNYDKNKIHITASFKEAMEQLVPTLDTNCVVLLENDLPDNYLK